MYKADACLPYHWLRHCSKRIYHLAFALGDVFATKPGDEFQSNRLVLAGDEEILDTDKKRFVEIHQKAWKKCKWKHKPQYENIGSQ